MSQSQTIRTAAATAVAGVGLAALAGAQIKSEGVPAAIAGPLSTEEVPLEFVQPPDVAAYLAEDAANGYRPLRYGALLPVDIGADNAGVWSTMEDGSLVWRFRVDSPGAYSIGLEFDDFVLPEGSSVFMYDATLENVYGAYGAVNNQPNEEILMEPFPGDSVIFEYLQPAEVGGTPQLHLGTVIYDYRNVNALMDEESVMPGGVGQGCGLIDVNCPQGDPWNLQKRAVVRTLSGGALCSGALVNNTAEDQTGYVLTADHCGQGSNTTFRFNYQTANCGSGNAPTTQNVSGCTVLTTTSTYDSRLLRINNAIPSSYNPFYAGWTRATQSPTLAFSMGHPSGGPKKISIDSNGASSSSITIANSAWFVNWNEGYLLGGSSGGPLFQQNGLVVGPACCVNSFTCSIQSAWYGRFDRFYNANNIGQWLDPAGSNPTILQGYDPSNPGGGGGGGGNPQINTIDPAVLPTVSAQSPVVVQLQGSGFLGVNDVTFNGTSLGGFPPQFTIVDDTKINLQLIGPFAMGNAVIEVIEGSSTDTVNLPIAPPIAPTVDLANSDPGFLIQAVGLQISMGSLPGDLHFLFASPSNVGSTLPGYFTLSLGNNLSSLVYLGAYTIDPSLGYAELNAPVSGLPTGTKIYVQSAVFQAANPVLPLVPSNLESGTVLF